MLPSDHLAALRRESAAFSAAWPRRTDARVAACPPWTALDLASHLGQRFGFWGMQVRAGDPGQVREAPDAPDIATTEWFDAQAAELQDTLEASDPEQPCWNWSGTDLTAGWVIRRMAHEAAVHRWDAERAVDTPEPIDSDLAVDGIDERIAVFAEQAPDGSDSGAPLIHFVATDVAAKWMIAVTPKGISRAEGGAPALQVEGSASTLDLLLWDRLDLDSMRLTATGDGRLLERWRSATEFP